MQIRINGAIHEVADDATVAGVLELLRLSNPQAVGVEINGEFVEREAHAERRLQANDSLELIQFLGGG